MSAFMLYMNSPRRYPAGRCPGECCGRTPFCRRGAPRPRRRPGTPPCRARPARVASGPSSGAAVRGNLRPCHTTTALTYRGVVCRTIPNIRPRRGKLKPVKTRFRKLVPTLDPAQRNQIHKKQHQLAWSPQDLRGQRLTFKCIL